MNNLQKEVKQICEEHIKKYDNKRGFIEDLRRDRCISGLISELTYYDDTIAFYKRNKTDIQSLLKDVSCDVGCTISELFGDNWDEDDLFAEETTNQNLLSWFAFEEIAFRMYE